MDYVELSVYLSIGTAILILIALYSALRRKTLMGFKDLFIPKTNKPTFGREAASIIIHPLFWIVCIGIASLFTVALIIGSLTESLAVDWLIFAFSLIIFFTFLDPLALWFAEGKYREPLRFIAGGISYGSMCALIAFFINSMMNVSIQQFVQPAIATVIIISLAPVFEEILKMYGLVIISSHKMFKNTMDGIIIGFAIGSGFALMENIFYIITKVPMYSIHILAFRAIYNTVAHGAFTAIGGAILGKIKMSFPRINTFLLLIPVFTAILIHISFNILAIIDTIGVYSLMVNYYIFSPLLTAALLIILLYLIMYAKNRIKLRNKKN